MAIAMNTNGSVSIVKIDEKPFDARAAMASLYHDISQFIVNPAQCAGAHWAIDRFDGGTITSIRYVDAMARGVQDYMYDIYKWKNIHDGAEIDDDTIYKIVNTALRHAIEVHGEYAFHLHAAHVVGAIMTRIAPYAEV